ncbi:MAG: oligosaccharide flippase family protein [Planctomycetes bacterium]|nr:oligosaccharide flippase family protein [Planctomycetota bacterium]
MAGRTSRGAALTLVGDLAVKVLALAVTAVVATRLDAGTYGLVLLAIAVHGLVDVLTNPVLATVLLREPDLTGRLVDVAWTIAVLRGVVLTVLFWVFTPWLAAFWPDSAETLTAYFRLLAFSFALNGITNLHPVHLRLGLRFLPAFLLESVSPVVSSVFALAALSLSPEPVWLIAAQLAGPAASALVSLLLVSPRPRFVLDQQACARLWRGSAPLLQNGVLGYLLLAGDAIFVEYLAGAAALGVYGMAQRWSQMPMKMVVQRIQNVLMPVYVLLRDDHARARHVLASSLSTMLAAVGLLSGLVFVFADDFFVLLDGSAWSEAGAVARAFVPFCLAFAVNGCLGAVLLVHGKLQWLNRIMALQVTGFFPAMYAGHAAFGLPGVAAGASLVALGTCSTMVVLTAKLLEMPRREFGAVMAVPVVTSAVAVATGWLGVLPVTNAPVRLAVGSAIAVVVFFVSWELTSRHPVAPRLQHRSLLQLARMLAR